MKNLLTEKLLFNSLHGDECTLEVCTAGEPDNDVVIFKGTAGDCLRKAASHQLSFSGDEYFSLYTNQGNYCGITFDEIAWGMGQSPDTLREILGLNDTPDVAPVVTGEAEKMCIKILSVEECHDDDYGASIVQFQKGNVISFAFSQVLLQDALKAPELLISELLQMKCDGPRPVWSGLSETLLDVVLENPFDMHFVEYDDDGWTQEKADALWDEICQKNLKGFLTCGEDGCFVTVYAGAMGGIDWTGHQDFGKPCFEHVPAENSFGIDKKASLSEQIQAAQTISGNLQGDKAPQSKDLGNAR